MADAEARRYHRWQFVLALADVALGALVLAWWTWSGTAIGLARLVEGWLGAPPGVVAGVALAAGASQALATFPLDVLAGLVLPRRAGLSTQSLAGWLADRAKMTAVGGVLGLLAVELVYALLRWSPARWWLWGAAALSLGAVLLSAVVPLWLVPLFYRLRPLEDTGLRTRFLALAARMGVPAAEVSVADLSRKGRAANAAVVGLGRTRRILVSDTLLGAFPPEEVEVVLAHELGHQVRGHMAQGLVVQGGVILLVLGAADRILRPTAPALGLSGPADPAGLPLFILVVSALGLAVTPLVAAWSRRLEREADQIALDVTRAPSAFVAAMERLGALNLAERQPGRLRELLFATHPSIASRIRVGQAAARAAGAL
jgi:STE24 endopeptidase